MIIKNDLLRKILGFIIPFILIPCVIFIGVSLFDNKKYIFISFFIALLTVCLFITGFEKKKTGTRRLILVSIMIALSVVGRFIPFFKPVTALTIISAMYLGGESGFMVGSLSALLSNFSFGQGPWTPFQMLAWGLLGLVAGFLAKPLKANKVFLLIFGVISGIIFSIIMDVWMALSYSDTLNFQFFLSSFITAIPHTVLYSVSNFVFLLILSKPFGEKLERIKVKYGV
ncbi:MAG: ECF transporter S component [Clostridia bacterium]|nr:ECF transporter S component [Clostridia bacterium]MBQ5602704.1 ECF transporter S component [Clostridia bacterium]